MNPFETLRQSKHSCREQVTFRKGVADFYFTIILVGKWFPTW